MAESLNEAGTSYSPMVGLIFVFNLIVGTGALAMPQAFAAAGWLLSMIVIIILAFMSYLTATFVIESMSSTNALLHLKRKWAKEVQAQVQEPDSDGEDAGLLGAQQQEVDYGATNRPAISHHIFDIVERIEMGQMAAMCFHPVGVLAFYVAIALYLYGDLAIYAVAIPKSLRDVVCTYRGNESEVIIRNETNGTGPIIPQLLLDSDPCWTTANITRQNAYRIFLAVFTVALGVFVFFNVQKTKILQLVTSVIRWLAFIIMIVLALIRLFKGHGQGHPPVVNFVSLPNLFGVCVYSFMCHHSLPSLVTPIKNNLKYTRYF